MKALVTGGGGFLGQAVVRRLLQRGYAVRSFSRREYPELSALGVEQCQGELANAGLVCAAAEGRDIIFHIGAKAGVWGAYKDFYRANVVGTQNVIAACRRHRIGRLVHTSSPSVVFDGRDMEGVNESAPYPEHFEAFYPQTKAEAERLVLAANDAELATVVLRPHLIWGPGDNHLVPRILARGRAGALRRIGDRPCLVDTIYIDNAAEAHLLAAERLALSSLVAGRAYFLAQGEPKPLWEIVNRILAAGGLPPVTRSITPERAYKIGWLLEKLYGLLRLSGEPRLTRFVARELSTAHWFDLSAARRDFGYAPRVSFDEGMVRLQQWLTAGQPPVTE
jgi:nucleoside-diphosphate-sugar epimerase